MEAWNIAFKGVGLALVGGFIFGHRKLLQNARIKEYFRGSTVKKDRNKLSRKPDETCYRFGNHYLPVYSAPGHFLTAGITGSGKTLQQRLLLDEVLREMAQGSDSRMLISDAKGEASAYLNRIGLKVPIYSFNPLESRTENPIAVAWDIGKDITSPLRVNNFSNSVITGDASGANGYFVKAARAVTSMVMKSFIKHSGTNWTFSDLINATSCWKSMRQVLERDEMGKSVIEKYLGDNNTGYGVATTVSADMDLYSPIAALWQRAEKKLSIREWLTDSSIVLLGKNETASATLDVLNAQIFTVFVEEVLVQTNSRTRRTWLWIDEAQETECLLRTGKVQSFANMARSRGGFMILAFQDIEGFRIAAGDTKKADSIISQCSYKALLRQESFESAEWASKLVGQFETIQVFHSGSNLWGKPDSVSEQRVVADAVLPSEFYKIPETHPDNGLSGYFLSSRFGANKMTIPSQEIEPIVVTDEEELNHAIVFRPESDQWIKEWTLGDKQRLGLVREMEPSKSVGVDIQQKKKRKLHLKALDTIEHLRMPRSME